VDREGKAVAPERLSAIVRRTEAELARLFGGYTTQTGTHGGWLYEKETVAVEEHAAIVTTYGGGKETAAVLTAVRTLAAGLARDLNQQCVAVIVNSRMYLVPPEG